MIPSDLMLLGRRQNFAFINYGGGTLMQLQVNQPIPANTAVLVMLECNVQFKNDDIKVQLVLDRDGTNIFSSRIWQNDTTGVTGFVRWMPGSITFIDFPVAGSLPTYRISGSTVGGTVDIENINLILLGVSI